MSYFTNYRVLDSKGSVLFSSGTTACFTEFTGSYGSSWSEYKPDKIMEVFYPYKDIQPILDLNNWWLEVMGRDFLCPITYIVIDFNHETDTKYPAAMKNRGSEKYICWALDYSQFNSKNHIKLALYLLRYLYEDNMSHMLNRMKEAYDMELEEDTWLLFKWVSATDNSPKTSYRHAVFYYPLKLNWIGKDYIQEKVKSFKGTTYSHSIIDKISAESRLNGESFNPYKDNNDSTLKGMDFEKYKKLINPTKITTIC